MSWWLLADPHFQFKPDICHIWYATALFGPKHPSQRHNLPPTLEITTCNFPNNFKMFKISKKTKFSILSPPWKFPNPGVWHETRSSEIMFSIMALIIDSEGHKILPRGGMCWNIHPLRQFAPWGPRAISMVEGCKLPKGRIFQFIATRGSVLTFFFPDRECIGNYTPNSRVVLPV